MAPKAKPAAKKAAAKTKAAAKSAATPSAPPDVDPPEAGEPFTDHVGVNKDHVARVAECLAYIRQHPAFVNVADERPSNVGVDGGSHIAPFDVATCNMALGTVGSYLAGGNLFWINLMHSLTPSVPISTRAISTLIETYFREPPKVFPDKITVSVFSGGEGLKAVPSDLTVVSPEEVRELDLSRLRCNVEHETA